jgi:hypothetical protein
VIDLHAHVLPGVDDGPETWDEALDILRTMAADGVTAVAATPHVRDDYPTTAETMERLVAELRERAPAPVIAHPNEARGPAAPERLRPAVAAGPPRTADGGAARRAQRTRSARRFPGAAEPRSRASGRKRRADVADSQGRSLDRRRRGRRPAPAHWLVELVPTALTSGWPLLPRPAVGPPRTKALRFFGV